MLKLIIADDERVIRETISGLIDWRSIGVELVGLCKDGIEAYNMIIDESPDIVLTDIRMPGLSGLELVKAITQTTLQVQFIILSGHEEFEYAREAMRYGIRHYLIKPCKESALTETVLQAIEDCAQTQRLTEAQEQHSLLRRTIQQDAMARMIAEGMALEDGVDLSALYDSYSQYIDFYHDPYFLVYIYYLEHIQISGFMKRLKHLATQQDIHTPMYGLYVKNTMLLYSRDEGYRNLIKSVCENHEVQIEEKRHTNLAALLEELLQKARRFDTVIAIRDFKPMPITNNQTVIRQLKAIYDQFAGADADNTERLCQELLALIDGATSLEFIKLLAGSICVHFSAINAFSPMDTAEYIMQVNPLVDMEVIRRLLVEIVGRARLQLEQITKESSPLVGQVTKYVEAHLSDPNLTLKGIAEQHLYLNVDYVSRQFKRNTGKNFSQYLTEQRVMRAKELLVSGEPDKIQFIAEQVGCENPQYFSQVFKKATGMTPRKWTQQMQGVQDDKIPLCK
ncbi:MAG: response regulator [Clostridiales bacterium]|jgi:YesN/AraC family two-component response regulator|nr:response regulator [Clostridiales bacterium]